MTASEQLPPEAPVQPRRPWYRRTAVVVAAAFLAGYALRAGIDVAQGPEEHVIVRETPGPTVTQTPMSTTTTTPPLTMPNGDPVFPGYPKLVPVESIDSRVASSYEGRTPTGQVVALAPGVYTPTTPTSPS